MVVGIVEVAKIQMARTLADVGGGGAAMSLDGVRMAPTRTAEQRLVGPADTYVFEQAGGTVSARYRSGAGSTAAWSSSYAGATFNFGSCRPDATERSMSACPMPFSRVTDGRLGLVENFTWLTRRAAGSTYPNRASSTQRQGVTDVREPGNN